MFLIIEETVRLYQEGYSYYTAFKKAKEMYEGVL